MNYSPTPPAAIRCVAEPGKVLELDGLAVVTRRFCVYVPTDDGPDYEWYDNRDEAEEAQARINSWRDEPVDDQDSSDG